MNFDRRIAFRLTGVLGCRLATPLFCATTALIAASHCGAASLFSVTPGNGRINEINPDTGELLNSFPTPLKHQSYGSGLAFTGTELFFAQFDLPNIWRLDARTGAVLGTFVAPTVGPFRAESGIDALAYGHTSFGPTLFALEYAARKMHLWNPTSGTPFLSYLLPMVNQPPAGFPGGGLDFNSVDGTLILSYHSQDTSLLRKIDPQTGQLVSTFNPPQNRRRVVFGIGMVGGRLFTSNDNSASIDERDAVTGSVIRSFPSPGGPAAALAGGPVPEPITARLAALGGSLVLFRPARRCRRLARL
jgi:hypothetical protein